MKVTSKTAVLLTLLQLLDGIAAFSPSQHQPASNALLFPSTASASVSASALTPRSTAFSSSALFIQKGTEQRKRERVSEDLEPDCYVDFPTPQQRIELRKVITKRQGQKKLVRFFLPEEETLGPFSAKTFEDLMTLLDDNELVEVRGLSKDSKTHAFSTAQRLVAELEMEYQAKQSLVADNDNDAHDVDDASSGQVHEKIVAALTSKGHSAVLYAQMDDSHPDAKSKKIVLRSSVGKKNVWVKRPKPARDERGQIIKGETVP